MGTATAQAPKEASDAPTVPALNDVRPEILRVVIDDQWDRGNDMFGGRQVKPADHLDWQAIAQRDQQRQLSIRSLLAEGKVQTGREFHFAALIFQHSAAADDLTLAHVLAVSAVIQGDPSAKWLAAATLDRYLQNQKSPQVFGTQFGKDSDDTKWTMDPYDRKALPDSVRALWCVISQSDQQEALKALQEGKGGANTTVRECN